MAYITTQSTGHFSFNDLFRSAGHLASRGLAAYRRHRELARAEAELRQLDDHELADIGLSRADISHAVRYGVPSRN